MMGLSSGEIDRLIGVLAGIRYQLTRIADQLSRPGTDTDGHDREVRYEELASYIAELRAKDERFVGYYAVGLESRIWRSLVQTLLGALPKTAREVRTTSIPLARLREGLTAGQSGFRNMGNASWQIFTGFMKTVS